MMDREIRQQSKLTLSDISKKSALISFDKFYREYVQSLWKVDPLESNQLDYKKVKNLLISLKMLS